MSFNPFDKPIGQKLEEADLQQLLARKVSEGFFIEFKRELPKERQKIANSIAAFANTYGGWYIVGVETDDHNVATTIAGFEPATGDHDPISVITELLKVGVEPTPLFHAQIVVLASGRLVAAVYVPDGQACPFVTRDGRIYRRTNDSSTPIPETSRHALDELVVRGRNESEAFERFALDDRGIEQKFDTDARVCVYISPSPLGLVWKEDFKSDGWVSALLGESKKAYPFEPPLPDAVKGNVPLDTALIRQQSVVLRQTEKGGEPFHGLSVEFDVFGRCRIIAPVQRVLKGASDFEQIKDPGCRAAFSKLVLEGLDDADQPLGRLHFFNISKMWLLLTALTAYYLRWLKPPPALQGFNIAAEAIAVSQHVPFCDNEHWAEHVGRYGLPVTLAFRSRVPEHHKQILFVKRDSPLWVHACSFTGHAFGLPTEFMGTVLTKVIGEAPPAPQ